jgi:hypothetical protein
MTSPATPASSPLDERIEDPEFLLCLALAYIGLPPGAWRVVVGEVLEAVSADYRDRLGPVRGAQEASQWRVAFRGWSRFNQFKLVVGFLGESKIGLIPVRGAAAQAARARALALLARLGVREASLQVASQIVRKVNLYLELAYLSGCAAYCGGIAYANAVTAFGVGAAQAVAQTAEVVGAIVNAAVTEIFVRPVLVARATLDPSNWDTSPLASAALALRLVGGSLWEQLRPADADAFLGNLPRPLSSFNVPASVLAELATAMTRTVNARGGISAAVTFTPEYLGGLAPLAFVQALRDWRLLSFHQDPEQVADAARAAR